MPVSVICVIVQEVLILSRFQQDVAGDRDRPPYCPPTTLRHQASPTSRRRQGCSSVLCRVLSTVHRAGTQENRGPTVSETTSTSDLVLVARYSSMTSTPLEPPRWCPVHSSGHPGRPHTHTTSVVLGGNSGGKRGPWCRMYPRRLSSHRLRQETRLSYTPVRRTRGPEDHGTPTTLSLLPWILVFSHWG